MLSISESTYQSILDRCPLGIVIICPQGEIHYANKLFLTKFKVTHSEVIKQNITQLIAPEHTHILLQAIENACHRDDTFHLLVAVKPH